MGNKPIWAIDLDGAEEQYFQNNKGETVANPYHKSDKLLGRKPAGTRPLFKELYSQNGGDFRKFLGDEVLPRLGGALKTVAGTALIYGGTLLQGTPLAPLGQLAIGYGGDLGQSGLRQFGMGNITKHWQISLQQMFYIYLKSKRIMLNLC